MAECYLFPTVMYVNNHSDYDSRIKDFTDEADTEFQNEIEPKVSESVYMYTGRVSEDHLDLSSTCRSNIEDYNSLSCVESAVENQIGGLTGVDSVMIVDDYDYSGFDGKAQFAEAEDSDFAVGILGSNGHTSQLLLHEVLHMYGAKHTHHGNVGKTVFENDVTVMGPYDIACHGNDPTTPRKLEIRDGSECTRGVVSDYINNHDT